MIEKPTIFLSSVFGELLGLRGKIHKVITEEYNWNSNAYEYNVEKYLGSSTIVGSQERVDNADLYIGVFFRRPGSSGVEAVPITELEFDRARINKIPIIIFDLKDFSGQRDEELELFLSEIKDPDYGVVVQSCRNDQEILDQLRRFLDFFGSRWEKGEKITPPTFLYEKLKVYKDGITSLTPTDLHVSPCSRKFPIELEIVGNRLSVMRDLYDRRDFYGVVALGSDLWSYFYSDGNLDNPEICALFSEFLHMWAGSCTWLGITSKIYGGVTASRLLKENCQRLGQELLKNQSNSLISHTLYVQARIKENLATGIRLDLFNSKNGEQIKVLERDLIRLSNSSLADLQEAQSFNRLYEIRRERPTKYSYSAYIYEALGDFKSAQLGFKNIIDYYTAQSNECSVLDVSADLGSSMVSRGLKENSVRLIYEGMSKLRHSYEESEKKYFEFPQYIMVGKEYAKRLISTGDSRSAVPLLDGLFIEAKKRKLYQQAETIQTLNRKAKYSLHPATH